MQIIFKKTQQFAVYRLDMFVNEHWHLAYVGTDKLTDVLKLRDIPQNPFLRKRYATIDAVCVTILNLHENEETALIARAAAIRELEPPGNNPDNLTSSHSRLACMVRRSDGMVYNSIRAAAESVGSPASSISAHLSGRYGYRSVRGYTFERIG